MQFLKALKIRLLQKSVNIFPLSICIKGKGYYLCIPLRRRRLFLEVFGLFSGLFIVCCWAGFSGKKS